MVHCNGLRFKVLPAYEEFEGKAAVHCAKIVEYMISNMHE